MHARFFLRHSVDVDTRDKTQTEVDYDFYHKYIRQR